MEVIGRSSFYKSITCKSSISKLLNIILLFALVGTVLFCTHNTSNNEDKIKNNKNNNWLKYKKNIVNINNQIMNKPLISIAIENFLNSKSHSYVEKETVMPFLQEIICKDITFFKMVGNNNDAENLALGNKYNIRIFSFVQSCGDKRETVFLSFLGNKIIDKKNISTILKTITFMRK
jgi:hypothetical protein